MLIRGGKRRAAAQTFKIYQLGYFAELANFEYVFDNDKH
jgi:hypothetical protein